MADLGVSAIFLGLLGDSLALGVSGAALGVSGALAGVSITLGVDLGEVLAPEFSLTKGASFSLLLRTPSIRESKKVAHSMAISAVFLANISQISWS